MRGKEKANNALGRILVRSTIVHDHAQHWSSRSVVAVCGVCCTLHETGGHSARQSTASASTGPQKQGPGDELGTEKGRMHGCVDHFHVIQEFVDQVVSSSSSLINKGGTQEHFDHGAQPVRANSMLGVTHRNFYSQRTTRKSRLLRDVDLRWVRHVIDVRRKDQRINCLFYCKPQHIKHVLLRSMKYDILRMLHSPP